MGGEPEEGGRARITYLIGIALGIGYSMAMLVVFDLTGAVRGGEFEVVASKVNITRP